MLTNGTEVACIRPEQEMMRQITGMPLGMLGGAGLARVLGTTDDPILHIPQTPEGTEAYVVLPLDVNGADHVEGIPEDLAFVVVRNPEAQGTVDTPRGDLPVVILQHATSKVEFLASFEARVESEAQRAYSELEAELFALAEQADDDDTPEFLD